MIDFDARAHDHLEHFTALAGALHVRGARAIDELFLMPYERVRDVVSQMLISSASHEPDLLDEATRQDRGARTSDRGLLWLLLLVYDNAANIRERETGDG